MTKDTQRGSVDAEFGRAVARLRAQRQMSQREFADALASRGMRVDGPAVSRIESGSRSVRLSEALLIAGALNEELSALVGGALTPEQEFIHVRRRAHESGRDLRAALQPFLSLNLWAEELVRQNPELLARVHSASPSEYLAREAQLVRDSFEMLLSRLDDVAEAEIVYHSPDSDTEGALSLLRAYAESMLVERPQRGELSGAASNTDQ